MKNKEAQEVFKVSIEEKLIQDFLALPDDKKLEVIDFVEFLKVVIISKWSRS